MIISPSRNYIFVHIPKTGGTSLAVALEERAKADDILIGDTPKARRRKGRLRAKQAHGRVWKHSTLSDIEGLVSRDFIEQAFCVTLVRNPWDRLVSLYHWLQYQRFDHPLVRSAQTTSFADFLGSPETCRTLRAQPYAQYLRNGEGKPHAVQCIRLEAFEEDAEPFWDHLGFRLRLPHENASSRIGRYQDHYDARLVDLVAQICAEDIARFGYSFG